MSPLHQSIESKAQIIVADDDIAVSISNGQVSNCYTVVMIGVLYPHQTAE